MPQSGPSFKSWTKGTSVICVGLGPEFDTLEKKKDIPQVYLERWREGGKGVLLRFNGSKEYLLSHPQENLQTSGPVPYRVHINNPLVTV